ncbi:MAG TPA: hypothetical protein VMZ53_27015 [Kofleriaceae bacterium]|nr:hypothetical protein [Kofleriaceae bacterium]
MIRASLFALAFASLTMFAGCGKKKDEGGGAAKTAEKSGGGDTKAAPAAGPTKLPKLGLQIDAPGKVEVGDAIMGEGHMLQGEAFGAMQIEVAEKKKTLDDAKSDAEMYGPKDLKEETLPDGWAVTYSNTGSMGKNFFVDVQRDIDGKTYHCSTTGSEEKQQQAVLAACKSLKK